MEQYASGGSLAPPQWIQSKLLQKKQCTLYEQRKLADTLMYFTRITIDELRQHLQNKSIDGYIDSIPYSLLLLETIYSKFYLYDKHEFPSSILKPERLLRQLVVYFAKECGDVKKQSAPKIGSASTGVLLDFKTVKPRAKNLMRTICDCCPSVLNSFKSEKHRLDAALEGLGLHGLVNFGDRTLIDVTEAVKQELADHQHRIKAFLQKVEKVVQKLPKEQIHCLYSINGFRGPVPSKSSHQRLMNLKVSDIKCRLQRNEHLLQLIKSSLTNADLENLARILQKRIFYDQTLLMELNFLLKSNTSVSSPLSLTFNDDPVASQVLVTFCKGYEKLMSLLPSVKADDSGLGDDDDNGVASETVTTVTSTKPSDDNSSNVTSNRQQIEINSQDSSSPYAKFSIKSDCDSFSTRKDSSLNRKPASYVFRQSPNSLNKTPSLTNIYQIYKSPCQQDLYLSKSTQHLAPSLKKSACWSFESLDVHEMQSRDVINRFNKTTYHQHTDDDSVAKNELRRCKAEIERLRRQLENTSLKLHQQQQENNSKIYSTVQTTVKETKNENNFQQNELVEFYSVLFSNERTAALDELSKMSEFQHSEELQLKILLSVIVLSFRSVQTDLVRSIDDVWKVLRNKTPLENLSNAEADLQRSIVQYLLFKARQDFYSKMVTEVSNQIWQTLFDYPLLKTCKKFNVFIKCCVKVAWELSCGKPRYNIEYEGNEFDAERHKRHRASNLKGKTIKRFVWPGLVEISTQNCVYRALVIT